MSVLSLNERAIYFERSGRKSNPVPCPGPANLYAPFGWADLPVPPPERVVKNRWTKTPPSTFMPRVKLSISNAILNLVDKRQRRRKWFRPVSPDQADIAMHSVGDDEAIERFRKLIQDELGDLGVAILDIRLDGGDTKSLVGMADLASPSSYQIKRTVQQIKALAQQFGDDQFQMMVQRALDVEQETLARRFAARATA